MTNVFHDHPYQREVETTLLSTFEEEGQYCAKVKENIFHAHGGGQKGDRGTVSLGDRTITVTNAIKDPYSDGDILLILSEALPDEAKGSVVTCRLDWDFRFAQMRLHTAVHLHHCMLERAAQKSLTPPRTSDIQDGFAFNRYEKPCEIDQVLVDSANALFQEAVATGADVKTYPDPTRAGFRWWECLGFKIPCGGTHVANISEIGNVSISYSTKKGNPTINISIT